MAWLTYVIGGVVAGAESKDCYKYRISMEYIPKLLGRTFALWFDSADVLVLTGYLASMRGFARHLLSPAGSAAEHDKFAASSPGLR
jgi:hypothetical protein